MSTHARYPDILVTNPAGAVKRASWMRRLEAEVASTDDVKRYAGGNAVLVVRSPDVASVLKRGDFLRALASKRVGGGSFRIVFSFVRSGASGAGKASQAMKELLSRFPRASEIEVAGPGAGEELAVQAAVAKAMLEPGEPVRPIRPAEPKDPIGAVKNVIRATAKLRSQTGRLDAVKVAGLFGITASEIASLLGRSRQAVSKTPDAPSLQKVLRPFERIGRLSAILAPKEFRAWLNQPSDQLDGQTPLEVVRARKATVVAEFAEDILTGAPA